MIRPFRSFTGETVKEMSIRLPSLVTRTVSICSTRWPLPHARENLLFLLKSLRRQQERDRLANDLLRPVTE